jgi:outer membrane immunogenic protein
VHGNVPVYSKWGTAMRKSVLMLIAAAVIDLTASQRTPAADIARGSPRPYAPVYVPPPLLIPTWTGCYVGGNIGGAWSNVDLSGVSGVDTSATNSGFAGGGQIGCDYQWNAWVVGIRNMLDATSLSSRTNISTVPFTGAVDSRTHWFDTLTARGGYLIQPANVVLLYAQGGAAWTNTNITFFDGSGAQLGEASNNRTGWTVGAGVEWRFAPQWSAFVEYNFMGFGTQSVTFTGCGGTCVVNASANADVQNVLAGVNYKFY